MPRAVVRADLGLTGIRLNKKPVEAEKPNKHQDESKRLEEWRGKVLDGDTQQN